MRNCCPPPALHSLHTLPRLFLAKPQAPLCPRETAAASSSVDHPETRPHPTPRQSRRSQAWAPGPGARVPSRQPRTAPGSARRGHSRSGNPRRTESARGFQFQFLGGTAHRDARVGADAGPSHHDHLPGLDERVRDELEGLCIVRLHLEGRHLWGGCSEDAGASRGGKLGGRVGGFLSGLRSSGWVA